jgi:hypothetical protein
MHSNIKVIIKLISTQGWLTNARLSPLSRISGWLSMPRIRSVIPILGVAHYEQISGSLCSRIVAHFTPDYSADHG